MSRPPLPVATRTILQLGMESVPGVQERLEPLGEGEVSDASLGSYHALDVDAQVEAAGPDFNKPAA